MAKLQTTKINGDLKLDNTNIFNLIYPVGAIYMSTNSINPSALFGGTWQAWGQGRMPIGIGSNGETNYTSPDQTGGSENSIAPHTHSISTANTNWSMQIRDFWGDQNKLIIPGTNISYSMWGGGNNRYAIEDSSTQRNASTLSYSQNHTHTANQTGQSGGNMPPYITCYMWKRVG